MRHRKVLPLIGLIAILAMGLVFLPSCKKAGEQSADKKLIKVGAILPLTGYLGFVGENFKNGLLLAVENNKDLEIIINDSKGIPKEGVTIIKRYFADNEIKVVITVLSSITDVVIPFFGNDSAKILIASITSKTGLPSVSPLIFRYFLSTEDEVNAMIKYLENSKIDTIGVLYVNDDFGKDALNHLSTNFKGKILTSEAFSNDEKNFRSTLSKIINLNIKNLYLIGYGQWYVSLVKQLRELNFDGNLFAFSGFGSPVVLDALKEGAINIVFSGPLFQPSEGYVTKVGSEFVNNYQKKYNKIPDHYAAYGFDIGNMISLLAHRMVTQEKNISSTSIYDLVNILSSIKDFEGVFGLTKQDQSGDFHFNVSIFRVDENLKIKECSF